MHPAFQGIEEMTVDEVTGVMSIRMRDGAVHRAPLRAAGRGLIARSTYRPRDSTLELRLTSGRVHLLEVDSGQPKQEQLRGRTVVYLDQNKWVDLARAQHAPDRLSPEELSSCQRFLCLVRGGRILCPLSSGHVAETGGLSGRWREHLTDLMVELSRGWIFRGVLAVRHDELAESLARACKPATQWQFPAVVTCDTRELFAGWPFDRPSPSTDLETEFRLLVGSAEAIFTVLTDGDPTSDAEALPVLDGWADGLTNNAARLSEVRPDDKRAETLAWFLQDLTVDLSAAALQLGLSSEAQIAPWLNGEIEGEIASMPYLGRLRDITDYRLRNVQDEWVRNDLVDMNNLALGSAYADVVIGERKTIGLLRRANRDRDQGAQLYANFRTFIAQFGQVR